MSATRRKTFRSATSSLAVTCLVFWSGSSFHMFVSASNCEASQSALCADALCEIDSSSAAMTRQPRTTAIAPDKRAGVWPPRQGRAGLRGTGISLLVLLLLPGERPLAKVADRHLALHRGRCRCPRVRDGHGGALDRPGESKRNGVALDRTSQLLFA